jgi:GNAT superfamily N-acetyltransferase
MIELEPHEFNSVLHLLAGIKQKVLPFAVCQGINPGRVFVDQYNDPQIAMIWSPVGYYCLAGDPAQARDLMAIKQVLTEIFVPASRASGETGYILIPSHGAWKDHLSTLLPGREIIEIYRRPFIFNPDHFDALRNWREQIPKGCSVRPVNAVLAEEVGVLASWASVNDFLASGMGFVLLNGDEIASVCISVLASRERVEIDVHTTERYQRRGYAILTASALIETCLQRGMQPNWECFWENETSIALAGKLGFTPLPDYPVYFWEE